MENSKRSQYRATLKKNRSSLVLGLIVLLSVIVLISIIGWIIMKPEPEIIQGEVDAKEVRISGKVPGRISSLLVEEGESVKAGDTLVFLNSPEIQAKLEQAKAAENAANAQNLKAIKGLRSEQIEGAFEMWNKSKAGLEIASKTYERAKKLFDNGVITGQKYDEAKAQYDVAVYTEKAARSQYEMAKNGAEKEDKLAAKAMVDRAKGAVSEVEAYIPETMLTSPISGEISEIYPSIGELVGTGAPIMSVLDIDNCWMTFNIREDLLKDFRLNKIINVNIPALELNHIPAKIFFIKALGSYATWKATKTTGEFDRKTFEVRVKPVNKIKDLRPGMSVLYEESDKN
jgi:HlyD family secretion protein